MNFLATIVRLHHALASRIRNCWYRALGVRMRGYVWMRRCSIPRNWGDITLEGNVSLDDQVTLLASGDAAHDKMVIEEYSHLVARLPAQGYGTTEFDMTDERREALLAGGRAAMRAYLERTPVTRDVRGGVVMPPTEAANHVAMRLLTPDT